MPNIRLGVLMEKAIVAFHDYLYYVAYYLLIVYYYLSCTLFLLVLFTCICC